MSGPTHDRSTRKPYTPPVDEITVVPPKTKPKKVKSPGAAKPKKEKRPKKAPKVKKDKNFKLGAPKKAKVESVKPKSELNIDSGVEVNFISKDNALAAKNMKLIQAGKKPGQSNTTMILLLVIIVLLSGIVISMYF